MQNLIGPIANHLWQSTLFAAGVAVVAYALRNNHARTRYWLWMAASLKFLVPFALLVTLGGRVEKAPLVPVVPGVPALVVEQISTSFAPAPVVVQPAWPRILGA